MPELIRRDGFGAFFVRETERERETREEAVLVAVKREQDPPGTLRRTRATVGSEAEVLAGASPYEP